MFCRETPFYYTSVGTEIVLPAQKCSGDICSLCWIHFSLLVISILAIFKLYFLTKFGELYDLTESPQP